MSNREGEGEKKINKNDNVWEKKKMTSEGRY